MDAHELMNLIADLIDGKLNEAETYEEAQEIMLSIHRVLLVLLYNHEERMTDMQIPDELIEINISAVEEANKKVTGENADIITMPGGDA